MKKIIAILLSVMLIDALLCACGGSKSYKDGTYTGQSQVFEGDEEGNGDGYGVVTLTIKDNAITACEFQTYEPDGTLKDDEYGRSTARSKTRTITTRHSRRSKARLSMPRCSWPSATPTPLRTISTPSPARPFPMTNSSTRFMTHCQRRQNKLLPNNTKTVILME